MCQGPIPFAKGRFMYLSVSVSEAPGSDGTSLGKILEDFEALGIPVKEKKVSGPTSI